MYPRYRAGLQKSLSLNFDNRDPIGRKAASVECQYRNMKSGIEENPRSLKSLDDLRIRLLRFDIAKDPHRYRFDIQACPSVDINQACAS